MDQDKFKHYIKYLKSVAPSRHETILIDLLQKKIITKREYNYILKSTK